MSIKKLTRYTHSIDKDGLPCMIEHPAGAWVLLADVNRQAANRVGAMLRAKHDKPKPSDKCVCGHPRKHHTGSAKYSRACDRWKGEMTANSRGVEPCECKRFRRAKKGGKP